MADKPEIQHLPVPAISTGSLRTRSADLIDRGRGDLAELLAGNGSSENSTSDRSRKAVLREFERSLPTLNLQPEAQYEIALKCRDGNGVRKDAVQAVFWFRKAAEQGHADAQSELGWHYEASNGVRRSYTDAESWYRRAAEQGHADAQHSLGLLYAKGKGVPQSYEEAQMWFRRAANQGHKEAKEDLGRTFKQWDESSMVW